jgi:hypothetical protein
MRVGGPVRAKFRLMSSEFHGFTVGSTFSHSLFLTRSQDFVIRKLSSFSTLAK